MCSLFVAVFKELCFEDLSDVIYPFRQLIKLNGEFCRQRQQPGRYEYRPCIVNLSRCGCMHSSALTAHNGHKTVLMLTKLFRPCLEVMTLLTTYQPSTVRTHATRVNVHHLPTHFQLSRTCIHCRPVECIPVIPKAMLIALG